MEACLFKLKQFVRWETFVRGGLGGQSGRAQAQELTYVEELQRRQGTQSRQSGPWPGRSGTLETGKSLFEGVDLTT